MSACEGDIELCLSRLLDLVTPSDDGFVLSRFSFLLDLSLVEELVDLSFAIVACLSGEWQGMMEVLFEG